MEHGAWGMEPRVRDRRELTTENAESGYSFFAFRLSPLSLAPCPLPLALCFDILYIELHRSGTVKLIQLN